MLHQHQGRGEDHGGVEGGSGGSLIAEVNGELQF